MFKGRTLKDLDYSLFPWEGRECAPNYWGLVDPAGRLYNLKVNTDQQVINFIKEKDSKHFRNR